MLIMLRVLVWVAAKCMYDEARLFISRHVVIMAFCVNAYQCYCESDSCGDAGVMMSVVCVALAEQLIADGCVRIRVLMRRPRHVEVSQPCLRTIVVYVISRKSELFIVRVLIVCPAPSASVGDR